MIATKTKKRPASTVMPHYQPGDPFIEAIIQEALQYDNIVIDAFCGFGGTSEGFYRTGKYKVIACINHWDKAIRTHNKRYPNCLHMEEDFTTADLQLIFYMVNKIRILKPGIRVHFWCSLECTNFSNAKGGMPRDADSRTLAEHMYRYVELFDFDCIWIENVKEFLIWGPMIPKVVWSVKGKSKTYHFNPDTDDHTVFADMPGASCPLHLKKKKGKIVWFGKWMIPDPKRKAEDFNRWRTSIETYGYTSAHRLLNAADYGVPQHRVRLFMQFNRKGVIAAWPKPTNDKKGANGLRLWNPIKPCLDLTDEGTDLLSYKVDKHGELKVHKKTGLYMPRIESKKTIERLMKGCIKHIFNNRKEEYFITKYMGNDLETGTNNGKSVDETASSVATSNRTGLVKVRLIDYYFGNGYTKSENEPGGVSGTKDGASVHTVQFISEFRNNGEAASVEKPSKAMVTKDKLSLDTISFVAQHNADTAPGRSTSVDDASKTATGSGGKMSVVNAKFMDHRYSSGQQNKDIEEPSGAVTGNPKQMVMNFDHFVMDTQFNNETTSLQHTSRAVTANRKHYYIINAGWFEGHSHSIGKPSSTIIARQDKAPQYLIVTETGELAIEVYDYDPPHYVAMKRFMADHGIVSIKMRMLKDTEMLQIQDLPIDYPLTRSATDNKKMIGNAVPPALVTALANTWDDNWKDYSALAA